MKDRGHYPTVASVQHRACLRKLLNRRSSDGFALAERVSRPEIQLGYRSPYTANRDTAAQINAHSPSENSSTKVSASPGLNLRAGSLPEWADDEGSCEPRQDAKDQTRWNAAFLSNWSSQLRRKPRTPPLHHATYSA